jgi:hypothetical protein
MKTWSGRQDTGPKPWIKTHETAGAANPIKANPKAENSRIAARYYYANQHLRKSWLPNNRSKLVNKFCLLTTIS